MLCRLCLKESLCSLNIFDSDGIKLDIADILGRHFWFKPLVGDRMSPAICTMCWSKVYNFHQFYVTIEQAHSMFSASNVEKEFVLEYVGNQFIDNDVVKEELSVTLCSTIEEEKEFVDLDFVEIDDSAKKFPETCFRIGNRNESMDHEFIKIDVNAKVFPEDPCPSTSIQKEQNNSFTKLNPGIDIRGGLNETCDKLNNEDLEYLDKSADDTFSGCGSPLLTKTSLKAGKNRKRLIAIEKKLPKLMKKRLANTKCKEKNNISSDRCLSLCNAQDPPLTTNFMEPVKNRKRITTSKKRLPQLREKRSLNEIFADFSNHETRETAVENSTEPFNDSSLSHGDPLEPELQKLAIPKSTESVKDAALSNDDTHEPTKNRKRITSSKKTLLQLREIPSLNEIFADFSNHETRDTAVVNSTEPFNDSSLSHGDPLEPELQKLAIPKSTESVKDAALSNDDTHEPTKNPKRITSSKKTLPQLREIPSLNEIFADFSNHETRDTAVENSTEPFNDSSLSHGDPLEPELQKLAIPKSTESVKDAALSNDDTHELTKNRKRITTSKKRLPQLRGKRSLNEIFADFSNYETRDTAVANFTEPFNDSSLSHGDPLEPELQKLAIPKSTESDTHEPTVKSEIPAKNRKKLASTEEKLAKLREKRGINAMCNDDELVKKYIPMRCDVCIFDCEEFETLKKHYRVEHPNIKPHVKCCNRKWYTWLSIVHHTYRHDDPEFFKCQECQRICTDQGTLSLHMMDFHAPEEDKIFNCDLCPKKFARKKRLEIHRNLHIPMNERPFVCDQCPTSRFSSEAMLRVHIRNTHRRASLVCHVCAKKIKTKALFEKHVRLHFEESGPKVKCTFEGCDSWLKDEDNLRLHIRRYHNKKKKEKIFTCEICGGEYKSRASFTHHMLRVHPKKTFPCDICNKSFKTGLNLREHMAQHTGEKNYQCPFCTSTFNVTGNYYSHLKKNHSVEYGNWRKNNITANKKILQKLKS